MSHTHRAPSRVLATSPRRLALRFAGPRVQADRKATRTALRQLLPVRSRSEA
jgi:hypothetical protein